MDKNKYPKGWNQKRVQEVIDQVESRTEAEAQFRKLCASRGLDWDTMTEAEREHFVDDLIHEDRECNP